MADYRVGDLVKDEQQRSEGAVVEVQDHGDTLTIMVLLASALIPISYVMTKGDGGIPWLKKGETKVAEQAGSILEKLKALEAGKAASQALAHPSQAEEIGKVVSSVRETLDKRFAGLAALTDQEVITDVLGLLCAKELGVCTLDDSIPSVLVGKSIDSQRTLLEQVFQARAELLKDFGIHLRSDGSRFKKGLVEKVSLPDFVLTPPSFIKLSVDPTGRSYVGSVGIERSRTRGLTISLGPKVQATSSKVLIDPTGLENFRRLVYDTYENRPLSENASEGLIRAIYGSVNRNYAGAVIVPSEGVADAVFRRGSARFYGYPTKTSDPIIPLDISDIDPTPKVSMSPQRPVRKRQRFAPGRKVSSRRSSESFVDVLDWWSSNKNEPTSGNVFDVLSTRHRFSEDEAADLAADAYEFLKVSRTRKNEFWNELSRIGSGFRSSAFAIHDTELTDTIFQLKGFDEGVRLTGREASMLNIHSQIGDIRKIGGGELADRLEGIFGESFTENFENAVRYRHKTSDLRRFHDVVVGAEAVLRQRGDFQAYVRTVTKNVHLSDKAPLTKILDLARELYNPASQGSLVGSLYAKVGGSKPAGYDQLLEIEDAIAGINVKEALPLREMAKNIEVFDHHEKKFVKFLDLVERQEDLTYELVSEVKTRFPRVQLSGSRTEFDDELDEKRLWGEAADQLEEEMTAQSGVKYSPSSTYRRRPPLAKARVGDIQIAGASRDSSAVSRVMEKNLDPLSSTITIGGKETDLGFIGDIVQGRKNDIFSATSADRIRSKAEKILGSAFELAVEDKNERYDDIIGALAHTVSASGKTQFSTSEEVASIIEGGLSRSMSIFDASRKDRKLAGRMLQEIEQLRRSTNLSFDEAFSEIVRASTSRRSEFYALRRDPSVRSRVWSLVTRGVAHSEAFNIEGIGAAFSDGSVGDPYDVLTESSVMWAQVDQPDSIDSIDTTIVGRKSFSNQRPRRTRRYDIEEAPGLKNTRWMYGRGGRAEAVTRRELRELQRLEALYTDAGHGDLWKQQWTSRLEDIRKERTPTRRARVNIAVPPREPRTYAVQQTVEDAIRAQAEADLPPVTVSPVDDIHRVILDAINPDLSPSVAKARADLKASSLNLKDMLFEFDGRLIDADELGRRVWRGEYSLSGGDRSIRKAPIQGLAGSNLEVHIPVQGSGGRGYITSQGNVTAFDTETAYPRIPDPSDLSGDAYITETGFASKGRRFYVGSKASTMQDELWIVRDAIERLDRQGTVLGGQNIHDADVSWIKSRLVAFDAAGLITSEERAALTSRLDRVAKYDVLNAMSFGNKEGSVALQAAYLREFGYAAPRKAHGAPADALTTLEIIEREAAAAAESTAAGKTALPVQGDMLAGKGRLLRFGGFTELDVDGTPTLGFVFKDHLLGAEGKRFAVPVTQIHDYLNGYEKVTDLAKARKEQSTLFFEQALRNLEVSKSGAPIISKRLQSAMAEIGFQGHDEFLAKVASIDNDAARALYTRTYLRTIGTGAADTVETGEFVLNTFGLLPRGDITLLARGDTTDAMSTFYGNLSSKVSRTMKSAEWVAWNNERERLNEILGMAGDQDSRLSAKMMLADHAKLEPGNLGIQRELFERVNQRTNEIIEANLGAGWKTDKRWVAPDGTGAGAAVHRWVRGNVLLSELTGRPLQLDEGRLPRIGSQLIDLSDSQRLATDYSHATVDLKRAALHNAGRAIDSDQWIMGAREDILRPLQLSEARLRLQIADRIGDASFTKEAALNLGREIPQIGDPAVAEMIDEARWQRAKWRQVAQSIESASYLGERASESRQTMLEDGRSPFIPYAISEDAGELTATRTTIKTVSLDVLEGLAEDRGHRIRQQAVEELTVRRAAAAMADTIENTGETVAKNVALQDMAKSVKIFPSMPSWLKTSGLVLAAGLGIIAGVGMLSHKKPRREEEEDPGPNSTIVGSSVDIPAPIGLTNQAVEVEAYDRHGTDISHVKRALGHLAKGGAPDVLIADRTRPMSKEEVKQLVKENMNTR